MGALDLIAMAAKAGKKSAPFFSKADVLLDELQRGKGTGDEFLTELVKKGAKPTELRERGIEGALKGKPKMTKAEVKQVFEEKAPPKVQEKVLQDVDYDEFLEKKARELYNDDYWNLTRSEKSRINQMYDELGSAQYGQYKTPGGENYREILLKLPSNRPSIKNMTREQYDEAVRAADASGVSDYASSHWRGEPNVLAHIRVQDFKTPEGKKVLLVDEIQSDWHQAGRKKGYDTPEKRAEQQAKLDQILNLRQSLLTKQKELEDMALPYTSQGKDAPANIVGEWSSVSNKLNELQAAQNRLGREFGTGNLVPDAPFKKNWHELAMKRVLDYAAENGYDTVAITPGAEQAKRYDLSKHIDELIYSDDGSLYASKGGSKVFNERVPPERLADYVGKDAAEKLMSTQPNEVGSRVISGLDLQVGGEGMKGFYDKILPDYLNTYGKQYGASVGQMDLPLGYTDESKRLINDAYARGTRSDIDAANAQAQMQTLPVHRFDITPQMREQIKTKGQPLYSKIGVPGAEAAAATGAATIGAEAMQNDTEQPVQNPVHFTENPDAMLLELMQRN